MADLPPPRRSPGGHSYPHNVTRQPDYGPIPVSPTVADSEVQPPRTGSTATVVFGYVSLVGALATVAASIVIWSASLLGAFLILIGIVGAVSSARTNRGTVAAFSGLQFPGAALSCLAPFVLDDRIGAIVLLVCGLVAVAGAVGVIVSGHRAPPVRMPTFAQPLGYTSDGQPFYPVVGYRSDGRPVTADQAPGYPQAVQSTNSMAITAFVLALVFTPLAIPLGHVARSQIRRTGEQGGGLATAALIIGYIWLGGMAILLVFLVAATTH